MAETLDVRTPYRLFAERVPKPVLVCEGTRGEIGLGRILYANDHFLRLLHVEREALVGKPASGMLDIPAGPLSDSASAPEPCTIPLKVRIRRGPNRGEFPGELAAWREGEAVVYGIFLAGPGGAAHDTARQAAEHALHESEQRFRDFADVASDWFWEMGPDYRMSYVSPRIVEVSGMPASHFIGKRREDFVDAGADPEAWKRHIEDIYSHRPIVNFTYRVVTDGAKPCYFRISGNPRFDGQGNFLGYRGTGSDVSAEIQAGHDAETARQRLVDAIDSLQEAFILFDDRNRLVLGNSVYRQWYPELADELRPGTPLETVVTRAVDSGRLKVPPGMTRDQYIAERMKFHDSENGHIAHLADGRWVLIHDRRTREGGIVRIATDISEARHREEELRTARDHAEMASRSKTEFLANMSHELRTPLNAIIGFSEVLKEEMFGAIGNERYVTYAHDIHDSGMLLLDIINDILDVSKAEAGKLELHEEPVDIRNTVMSSLRLIRARAAEGDLRLKLDIPRGLPPLMVDQRMLKQILINLLSNAVKFTPAGGEVTISVECRKGEVAFSVADTGIGIDEKDLGRALEPFAQVDSAFSRQHQGTGLGLPLVKSLVELHGGRLSIESRLGQGTRVTVHLGADRVLAA